MNYLNDQFEQAVNIALEGHKGQVCKSGVPYIVHIMGVVSNLDNLFPDATMHERIVAVLHDVVEDTSIDGAELIRRGIDPIIVGDVLVLTRAHDADYADYVINAGIRRATRRVKMADLRHNMHPNRQVDAGTAKQAARFKKYTEAFNYLAGIRGDIENTKDVS